MKVGQLLNELKRTPSFTTFYHCFDGINPDFSLKDTIIKCSTDFYYATKDADNYQNPMVFSFQLWMKEAKVAKENTWFDYLSANGYDIYDGPDPSSFDIKAQKWFTSHGFNCLNYGIDEKDWIVFNRNLMKNVDVHTLKSYLKGAVKIDESYIKTDKATIYYTPSASKFISIVNNKMKGTPVRAFYDMKKKLYVFTNANIIHVEMLNAMLLYSKDYSTKSLNQLHFNADKKYWSEGYLTVNYLNPNCAMFQILPDDNFDLYTRGDGYNKGRFTKIDDLIFACREVEYKKCRDNVPLFKDAFWKDVQAYKSNLNEAVGQQYLYHGTKLDVAFKILSDNVLYGSDSRTFGGGPIGVSTSRSLDFAFNYADNSKHLDGSESGSCYCVLALDREKLKHHYKIVPFKDDGAFDYDGIDDNNPEFLEKEEVVIGDIKNIKNYIVGIYVSADVKQINTSEKMLKYYLQYSKIKNIDNDTFNLLLDSNTNTIQTLLNSKVYSDRSLYNQRNNIDEGHFDKIGPKVNWKNNMDAIGNVPSTIGHKLFAKMPAWIFLKLTPSFNYGDDKWFDDQLKSGNAFGIPFLKVEFDFDNKTLNVIGHEGRHRVSSITRQPDGEIKDIPVAILYNHDKYDKIPSIEELNSWGFKKEDSDKVIHNSWIKFYDNDTLGKEK